ncbi:MAG: patatin family protein [Clostridia bacterium]|nr:patatin family protein [Clostridia bacterium]
MKKGLVLEGGAMRGLFSAGVMDVMMENNIKFDGAIGVSAGACFGCNYKSEQIGRAIRYNLKYSRDKRYCSFYSLITTGDLYGADFCYREIPEELDIFDKDAFNKNPMKFYTVCSDIETGEAVYTLMDTNNDNYLDWIRASASMPLVSRIVEIDGGKYLDGGMTDSVPLKQFQKMGYEKNIVILTQPKDYVKKPNKALWLIKMTLKKYPKIIEAIKNRHIVYNQTTDYIKKQEDAGNALVICPSESLPIKRIENDPEKLKLVYNEGRRIATEQLPKIKEFLEQR